MKENICATNCLLLRRARHETLNLLTPLKIHLKLLERSLPRGESRVRLERALKLVDRLSQEMRFLGQFGKLQPESILNLTRHVIEQWTSEQTASKVKVHVVHREVDPNTLVMVTPSQITTLLINLLRNAERFSPPGGQIVLSYIGEGGLVKVAVADQGPGFSTGSKTEPQATLEQDHGHGLQICRQIAGNHGSDLVYQSLQGGGCEVYFYLRKYDTGEPNSRFTVGANGPEIFQPMPAMASVI